MGGRPRGLMGAFDASAAALVALAFFAAESFALGGALLTMIKSTSTTDFLGVWRRFRRHTLAHLQSVAENV